MAVSHEVGRRSGGDQRDPGDARERNGAAQPDPVDGLAGPLVALRVRLGGDRRADWANVRDPVPPVRAGVRDSTLPIKLLDRTIGSGAVSRRARIRIGIEPAMTSADTAMIVYNTQLVFESLDTLCKPRPMSANATPPRR